MSFDFIPLDLYGLYFYYAMLLTVVVMFFDLNKGFKKSNFGLLFVGVVIIYMGFRPISGRWFGDMGTYNGIFIRYQQGASTRVGTDVLFDIFMKFCSGFMTANFFFLTCAFLYIYPLYAVCKKWFKEYWFYAFLLLVTSFSFWAYGTNGIRNGIAGSLFLLGISRNRRIWQIAILFVAISIHKTMMLPLMGFILAQFYNKPKYMIGFWILCIPLSLVGGGFWEVLFASLGFGDDRLSYLTAGNVNNDNFSSTGFRWDFLAYSATAVFAGWYFIIKKNFKDQTYYFLFNTYIFANAFWILVIRANFSNRFAYLSWFMMALVIVYPLITTQFFKKQSRIFAKVLVVYFLFTYLLNVLLLK